MKEGVPEHWPMLTLAEVSELKGGLAKGKKRAKDEVVRTVLYLRVANVQAGYLNLSEVHSIDASEREISKILLQDGDVLFNEGGDRDKLGRGWVWEGQIPECIHQNHVFRARPRRDVIDPFFLSYWGNSRAAKEYFEEEGKQTVNLASISLAKLGGLPVPVPPLEEQRRIVAKLEALLAKVDTSRKRLERIPTILKRFRQAVLAAACDGRLTEDWRAVHTDSPEWSQVRLGDLTQLVTSGSRGWAEFYADDGALFIRAQNINTDKLVLEDIAHVQAPKNAEGARTRVRRSDLLVTITGANVTKTALVEHELPEAYVNQHIGLVRLKNSELAPIIHLVLVAPNAGRKQLEEAAYGAGKPGLNLQNLKDVAFDLPEKEERAEIIRRASNLLSLADQIEARYLKAKTHVDRLTQSILAKAFRGELVPQDPNDEPAEMLLARLKAQPADAPSSKRRGRPKKAGG